MRAGTNDLRNPTPAPHTPPHITALAAQVNARSVPMSASGEPDARDTASWTSVPELAPAPIHPPPDPRTPPETSCSCATAAANSDDIPNPNPTDPHHSVARSPLPAPTAARDAAVTARCAAMAGAGRTRRDAVAIKNRPIVNDPQNAAVIRSASGSGTPNARAYTTRNAPNEIEIYAHHQRQEQRDRRGDAKQTPRRGGGRL